MARRLLKLLASAAVATVAHAASAQFDVASSVEAVAVDGGPLPSFADGSMGKLRYGEDDGALQLTSAFVRVSSTSPSFETSLSLDFNSQADDAVGVTEAVVLFRPLPVAGVRPRVKLGAFRPPVSLEHAGAGWATLYTTNASAINSWIGEELGGLGVEASMRSDEAAGPFSPYWTLGGAAFYGNDPSGTLLSWRGWSVNNWQSRIGDVIPLADLPVFDYAEGQAHRVEPFLELDDRPGFYVNGEVGRTGSWRVRALLYDNRADPVSQGHGQTGWRTRFLSLGLAGSLPGEVGVVAQWLDGRTYAGPHLPWGRPVDNGFDSAFVLLTRVWDEHRLSIRREWFGVDDNDSSTVDPNDENGDAWTLSYQWMFATHWLVGVEWVEIDSRRTARVFEDEDETLVERTLLGVVRWTF